MTFESLIADTVKRALAEAPPPKRLLSAQEAAEYMGMSVAQLRELRARGVIRSVILDRRDRYDVKDLDRLIEESKT